VTTMTITTNTTAARVTHWETSQFTPPATSAPAPQAPFAPQAAAPTSGVDALVAQARSTFERISVRGAYQLALHARAVIVDIRPHAQRQAEGEIHPALRPVVIERNVLEWRLDPAGDARLPWVTPESRVLVLCQEGYASSLAAASLVLVGLPHATDIVGGLRAWREAGLPMAPAGGR
jgi:rhodanese-related sulfurtransferase